MSYYPTLREDVERARAILRDAEHGTFLSDQYALLKLLASFVEVIETMDVKVCELALRARKRGQELTREPTVSPPYMAGGECLCRACGHVASTHNARGQCESCDSIEACWS